MLTIIHTWTCCQCGKVKAQRIAYGSRTNSVMQFPLPIGWTWIDDSFVVCEDHIVTITDKPK